MSKKILSLVAVTVAAAAALPSQQVMAHGYISKPESRGLLCRMGENSQCGAVNYEPQSLEGPDRYPESGVADGQLASAGHGAFSALNAQSINRWAKRHIKSGANEFTWTFTANHVTRDWRYFITKKDWDPNQPLTRAQFEPAPFCEYSGNNRQPPRTLTHLCNVPSDRAGYHVVMGVWDVGDTPMSFYNMVDLMIDNGNAGSISWQDVGDIYEGRTLNVGDKVSTVVFTGSGEQPSLRTEILIQTEADGAPARWPQLLAEEVNRTQSWLKAGVMGPDNRIIPIAGKNDVFAQSGSGINRVEIRVTEAPPPAPEVNVSGIAGEYLIGDDGVLFSATVDTDTPVTATVSLNKGYNTVAKQSYEVNDYGFLLELPVTNASAGHYMLVFDFVAKNGGQTQKVFHLNLVSPPGEGPEPGTGPGEGGSADAEFSFPSGLGQYKAGTLVFQPKNNKLYRCKPWPYNGYCVQWSPGSNQYEPGIGLYWQMAWDEVVR
ncbi:N-acetylglucosamine-binding protein GbpA [Shewanella sp. JM162201]|uniref:N-acetylglucosamine-binding protein GbpA n=1 Tax=Shewanella jiangmenensis TaxID=2837387 RepID=A0ABS5V7J9_9GAMM|nr:N-acetylglucosamine-binding protein GbpA [Shewanella jiangmenensis]MBT1446409.1 N-acetylglucosamine-binding protein GbpA [Shewanella jiangmenensis]